MSDCYKLDGHTPVPCDYQEAEALLDDINSRRVWFTRLSDCDIRTVFLVFDQNQDADGPPILLQTLVCGGVHCDYQARYSTWDEALRGPAHAVRIACGELEHARRSTA